MFQNPVTLLNGCQVDLFGFFHQWTYPINLLSVGDRCTNPANDLVQAVQGH
jgi:hypothetical protein